MSEALVGTWGDGVFVVSERGREHELAGHAVRGLTTDGRGEVLAIVDNHTLQRRSHAGAWSTVTTSDRSLACCAVSQGSVYLGTEDARVLCLTSNHELVSLEAFQNVQGRQTWSAGQMLVNGVLMGPPLGVRSISATTDGVLLANVHVGGIPRSTDGGQTWHPTIAVATDVHEVKAHPTRPNIVVAAAAAGLCMSSDGGATWSVQTEGLHSAYSSAVAFLGNDVLISSSEHHFASQGRVYRRPIDENVPLSPIGNGLPEWTQGIVDTHCIDVRGSRVAFADGGGNLYISRDAGRTWSTWSHSLPAPSSLYLL